MNELYLQFVTVRKNCPDEFFEPPESVLVHTSRPQKPQMLQPTKPLVMCNPMCLRICPNCSFSLHIKQGIVNFIRSFFCDLEIDGVAAGVVRVDAEDDVEEDAEDGVEEDAEYVEEDKLTPAEFDDLCPPVRSLSNTIWTLKSTMNCLSNVNSILPSISFKEGWMA